MSDDPRVISRKAARAAGLSHYFTGVPCARGHLALRECRWKKCLACGAEKVAERRSRDPEKAKSIAKSSYERNREKRLNDMKGYRSNNSVAISKTVKAYYSSNKEIILAKNAAYRAANAERLRAARMVYTKENPEVFKNGTARRRARLKSAPGSHTVADIREIKAMQNHRCAYCRVKLRRQWSLDHIVPLAGGGSNGRSNLQITCRPCNQSKGAKEPERFARSRGMLL